VHQHCVLGGCFMDMCDVVVGPWPVGCVHSLGGVVVC